MESETAENWIDWLRFVAEGNYELQPNLPPPDLIRDDIFDNDLQPRRRTLHRLKVTFLNDKSRLLPVFKDDTVEGRLREMVDIVQHEVKDTNRVNVPRDLQKELNYIVSRPCQGDLRREALEHPEAVSHLLQSLGHNRRWYPQIPWWCSLVEMSSLDARVNVFTDRRTRKLIADGWKDFRTMRQWAHAIVRAVTGKPKLKINDAKFQLWHPVRSSASVARQLQLVTEERDALRKRLEELQSK